jgi:hypothetical protein
MTNTQYLAPAPGVTLDMIVEIVCDRMDRSRVDVIGKGDGSGATLRARHVVMWLARRLLRIPHAEIGAALSGREAGQVMNAEARINALRCADPKAQAELNEIELELRAAGLAAENAGLHLRPTVDAVAVARRVNFNARAATQVSVAEIQALAAHVLQHQSEPAHV